LGEGDGMLVEEDRAQYVGPIMPHSILSDDPNTVDPNPEFGYENLQLRLGLTENSDFMIVDSELWTHLYKIYGGIPLERYTYRKNPEDMNVSVEVWLQKVENIKLNNPLDQLLGHSRSFEGATRCIEHS
jgi:hypothetical protein